MNPDFDPSPEKETPPAEPDAPRSYVLKTQKKEPRTVPLAAAIGALVTAVIIAVLTTFALTVTYRSSDLPNEVGTGQGSEPSFSELITIDKLFRQLTVRDLDDQAIGTALLKAYVEATGDRYAEYFTAEEYESLISEQNGEMCGIGISVINDTLTKSGVTYQAMIIANVYPDSPAEAAGVRAGDAIMYVRTGEEEAAVNDIGYTEALARLKGEEGTVAVFTVWRRTPGGDYEAIPITAVRKKLTTRSVTCRVSESDPTVGIVRATGFDNTTAPQFREAVDALRGKGCTAFIFDLRNNPGGLLTAVEDVLTFFLKPGDVMLYTRDREGKKDVFTVTVKDGKVTSGSGKLTVDDVGVYAGLPFCVLINGGSASAAELFTANVRDHGLGTVVGVKSFGKGTMQTTYSLSRYGYSGALKLTTRYYDPPSGENYDGPDKGIIPDRVVDLTDEAKEHNINVLPEAMDDQIRTALSVLRP